MPLSRWVSYCAMVAEVTGLDVEYIYHKLPLSRGRQYQTVWLMRKGIECRPLNGDSRELRRPVMD